MRLRVQAACRIEVVALKGRRTTVACVDLQGWMAVMQRVPSGVENTDTRYCFWQEK